MYVMLRSLGLLMEDWDTSKILLILNAYRTDTYTTDKKVMKRLSNLSGFRGHNLQNLLIYSE